VVILHSHLVSKSFCLQNSHQNTKLDSIWEWEFSN